MKNSKLLLRLALVIASVFIFTQCEDAFMNESALKGPGSGGGGNGGGGGGGVPTESVGSNLSFPVIWSDGVEKTLRLPPAGTQKGEVKLDGAFWFVWGEDPADQNATINSCNPLVAGMTCYGSATDVYKAYLQKDANNYWEAYNAPASVPVNVDLIDWGDNLESIDWNINSKVRTEVALYENLADSVLQYAMRHVSGWGTDEMHGLQTTMDNKIVYGPGRQATVYSHHARFTIQKLSNTNLPNLTWDPTLHAWTGDINAPIFNKAAWDTGDGPGYYSAEINIKGKIIYGYTWDVAKLNEGAGTYRLTFSFDDDVTGSSLNTFFVEGESSILSPAPEVEGAAAISAASTIEPRVAKLDFDNNLTYIDVIIKTGKGGGSRKPITSVK